jgi:glycogen synthase
MINLKSILIVSSDNFPHIGGKSSHIVDLIDGLKSLTIDVKVISLNSVSSKLNRLIQLISLPTYLLGKDKYNKFYKKIYFYFLSKFIVNKIKFHSIDLISAQDAIAVMLAKKASKTYKIPIVLTMHTYFGIEPLLDKKNIIKNEEKILNNELISLNYVSQIICVDTRITNHVIEMTKKLKLIIPIHTIHNFTNTEIFKPYSTSEKNQIRKSMNIPESTIIISCFRRLVEKNGVIYLIKSIKSIVNEYDNFKILIFGDGPQRSQILNFIKSNSLESKVYLYGEIDNKSIRKFYGISDITVVPSITVRGLQEATSISAIESMSMGIPVIASNIGGLKELIIDNINGLLVEEKNIKQIADSLITLIRSKNLRETIGSNSREYIISHNSHILSASKYLDIYKNVS